MNNPNPSKKRGHIHKKFITHSQHSRIESIYFEHEDKVTVHILGEIEGGNMMKKTKWIVGLSIASLMALSGTVFALNSGPVVAQSIAQTIGVAPRTIADSNGINSVKISSPVINQLVNTTESSPNDNPNGGTTPGGNGYGNGYGGGYGMMGSYGMMGGQGIGNNFVLNVKDENSAAKDMATSLTNATVDKSANTITFTRTNVKIVMLGGPEQADGKFVIAGLINPIIRIPQGANVTMEIINEDTGMTHGVELTTAPPPYYYMVMMQGGVYPGSFIPPIPEAAGNQYPSAQVSFTASLAGEFYYICQYPGHAAKGMYGKIIVG